MKAVEDWVQRLRERLGLTGFPGAEDTERLVEMLAREEVLWVETHPVPRGYQWGTARRRIVLPEGADEEVLLEEIGHALLSPGSGSALPAEGRGSDRLRLLLGHDRRQEADAGAFVLAWKLPRDLLLDYLDRPEELQADSGCTAAEIAARWEMLK